MDARNGIARPEGIEVARKALAGILAVFAALLLALAPGAAWAEASTEQTDSSVASAVVDGTATYYDDLASALDAADSESTITLLADVTLASSSDNDALTVAESASLTLDLAGHTITANARTGYTDRTNYAIGVYGALTITDSSTGGTGAIVSRGIEVYSDGTLTIEAGTVTDVDAGGSAVYVYEGGTVYVKGGTLSATYEGSSSDSTGGACLQSYGTVYISGGTFTSVSQRTYAIIIYSGTATIDETDGTVLVTAPRAVSLTGSSSTTIAAGTFAASSTYALYIEDPAEVTITGGTFSSTGTSGVAVYMDIYSDTLSLTITGGTFSGSFKVNYSGSAGEDETDVEISGGTFSDTSSIASYLVEGAEVDENGTVMVPVASVTNDGTTTKYDDLQEAADAVEAGGTLTLLADVTLEDDTGIAILNKGTEESRVTVDLNGHILTGNNAGSGTGTGYYYDADGTNVTAGILQVVGSYVTLTDTSTGGAKGTIANTNSSSTSYAAVAIMLTYDTDNKDTTSDLVIKGGVNVTSAGTASSRYQAAVYLYGASGKVASKLTVNDATITGPYAVSTYSTSTSYFSVDIKGGTFVTTQHAASSYGAVYATSSTYAAVYDISGGTFNSWCYYNREALAEGCVVLVAEETDEDGTGTGTYLYTVTSAVPDSYFASVTLSGDETPTYYQTWGNLYGLQLALDKSTASSYGYPSGGKTSAYFAGTGATISVVADATYTMAEGDFLGPLSGSTVYLTFEVAEGATLSGSIALGVAQLTVSGAGMATDFVVSAVTSYGTGTYAGTTNTLALDSSEVDSTTGLGTYYCYVADAAALVTFADGSKAYYTSAPAAITKAAANESSTVTLLADASTANASISVSKSFTLDLAGHTLTLTRTSDTASILTIIGAGAEVVITDTSEEGGGTIQDTGSASLTNKSMFYIYGANSSLKLTNVTIQMYGAASSGYNEVVYADTTSSSGSPTVVLGKGLTIKEFDGTGEGWLVGVAMFGYYDTDAVDEIAEDYAGTTVQVLDGATVTVSGPAIMGEGTTHGTTIEVSGGALTSTEGTAIYLPEYGTTTVSGGTITGAVSGIEIRSGVLNVTGGTICSTAESFDTTANGSGASVQGAGIAVSQHSTNLDLAVTVTGGTISGIYGLYEADLMDTSVSNITLVVSEGAFMAQSYTGTDEEGNETELSGAPVASADCTGFVTGGLFTAEPASGYLATGYQAATVTWDDDADSAYTSCAYTVTPLAAGTLGGSLRIATDEDGAYVTSQADLRLGFYWDGLELAASAEELEEGDDGSLEGFGWEYGTSGESLSYTLQGANCRAADASTYVYDGEATGTVANLVLTGTPLEYFGSSVYARMYVTYRPAGASYTATVWSDTMQKSVMDVVKGVLADTSLSSTGDAYQYASALNSAYSSASSSS